ncbi:MAG: bifunctional UDP-N-acetylmuramoyl-tripeptide:D-alanyl-D-alanine ligase/alanine racemase [Flavitalea sp.]
MKYHLENIAVVVKGKFLLRNSNPLIEHLLLDSRKIIFPQSSLFIALKGSRRNGHLFIQELYEKGVRSFIVGQEIDTMAVPEANVIMVKDPLHALQLLAIHHRKQFSIPVIGITGSNGKTIVKEWLNQLLEEEFNIVRSPKSYNSQIGVPLSVWQMNEMHELAIFEAGISESGEMSNLQKIIQPTIGIFTNIGEAHSEGFINLRQKINEKLQLFTHVNTLVYCRDNQALHEAVAMLWQQLHRRGDKTFSIFNWSVSSEATLQIQKILKDEGQSIITASRDTENFQVTIPFTDDASIENAIHCLCILLELKIPQAEIQQKMPRLSTVAMRLELKNGINNCSIINDSYSADLSSLKIALDFLMHQQQHAKRTVILSDILQSGKVEKELYHEVARALEQRKVNRFIGIGRKISRYKSVFEEVGSLELSFYDSVDDFKKNFQHFYCRDETILLKGARVFELEQIDALLEQKVHQTILEINLSSLVNNLHQYQQLLQPTTKVMAMVKAFSYGSGGYEIANVLQFQKVDYLAVAYADEGVELRKGGIALPIMVMNTDVSTFDLLVKHHLEPELYSPALLLSLNSFLENKNITEFPVHIELETGMNRLGFSEEEISILNDSLKTNRFKVRSVFTHLVSSEHPEHDEFTLHQADVFRRICHHLDTVINYPYLKHIANTSGITRHSNLQLDMVRLGIGLYGIGDSSVQLKEVSTLKSTIAQIKHVKAGENVSYGRRGIVSRDSTIATVRIGYADGYPRSLSNGVGKMLIHGQLAPIVGMICMDMTMIDVTDITDVDDGDEVIVFGKDLSVKQLANWAQTIPYEILTGVSQRVKRVYFEE